MKINYLKYVVFLLIISCGSTDKEKNINEQKEAASEENATSKELDDPRLASLNLPDGFSISIFAEVENARSLAMSPSGVIYVGNRSEDKVYALRDTNGDWKAEEKYIIAEGLQMPNGVAFKDGDLYVAEVSKIWKFPQIEKDLNNPPKPVLINGNYPSETHHGWKYIAFGPDGKLYVPVGAPCNICKSEEIYASITRIDPDGSNREIVASGIRNTVGFDWHPETGELWFTDNGRDMMGDNIPPCELNKISKEGQHFGYPYCHGGDIADPQFGSERNCLEFERPEYRFNAHTAPLGMSFVTSKQFPLGYEGDIIVAQHGSWNRSRKIGYRLMHMEIKDNRVEEAKVFVDGWLDEGEQEAWGRPVDVLAMPDGSILVSDDQAGLVYRIAYTG